MEIITNQEIEEAIPEIIDLQTWSKEDWNKDMEKESHKYHKGSSSVEELKEDFFSYLAQKVVKDEPYCLTWRTAPEITKENDFKYYRYYHLFAEFSLEEFS